MLRSLMARLIRVERTGPYKIPPEQFPKDGKSLWICGCGLSRTMPICDQTHKARCPGEKPGVLYTYDPATKQVIDEQPDTRVGKASEGP
jgi:CDGSH-type Zn-finger protein